MSAARRSLPLLASIRTLGYEKATAILIGILFAVGTAAHLWPPTLPLMVAMTPWFLLGCALATLYPALRARGRPFIAWVALAWALTFALEALGVATGLVFGAYGYGDVLGPMALEVPVIIALNWVLVAHGAWALARRFVPRSFAAVPVAAAIGTAFDWIMEPVAIRLGYWTWDGGDIPLRNYAAWFVITFAAATARHFLDGRRGARGAGASAGGTGDLLAFAYLVVQAAFFALLRLGWAVLPGN